MLMHTVQQIRKWSTVRLKIKITFDLVYYSQYQSFSFPPLDTGNVNPIISVSLSFPVHVLLVHSSQTWLRSATLLHPQNVSSALS